MPSQVIELQKQRDPRVMNQDGGHWSSLGNQIFGNAVADSLLKDPVFIKILQTTIGP
jgi:lysophospholipase L1-like esterase